MKQKVELWEYAGQICSAMKKGILLTTRSNGKVNTMTIGWGFLGIEWGKPIFVAYVRQSRHTKKLLDKKLFGVFQHTVEDPNFILFRGFDDQFWVPHSRNTTVAREDIEAIPGLKVLSASSEAGVYAVKNDGCKQVFLMGHAEYDRDTLYKEYTRDLAA